MLRFSVFQDGRRSQKVDLSASYLIGSEGVPVRADIEFKNGEIICRKNSAGPAGLVLMWPVEGAGRILLETTRLPERKTPYVLQLELARGRLMRLAQKSEDWNVEETSLNGEVIPWVEKSKDLLIEALKADSPQKAAQLAEQSLSLAVGAGDAMTHRQAEILIERRVRNGTPLKDFLGIGIDPRTRSEVYLQRLAASAQFVSIPFLWRQIEPAEQKFDWKPLDTWIEWLTKKRIPIKGSDLVSFTEESVPDWVYLWEHDFETIRDVLYEHVKRILNRYGSYVQMWDAVSGIHANNCLSFSFEELIELSRMSTSLVKQLAPRASVIVDMVDPWGEYYARNQRTIPPLLYADTLVQNGIQFDALGLQFRFGAGQDGMFTRDLFQVAALLDKFNFGRSIHVSGVGVPSSTVGSPGSVNGGFWRGAWSESVQADWLKQFFAVALGKPFVETVTWKPLSDRDSCTVPNCGLLNADFSPKPAFQEVLRVRRFLEQGGRKRSAG